MPLLQKIRDAFAPKPAEARDTPTPTTTSTQAWRSPQQKLWLAHGHDADHHAARPVLLEAGFQPQPHDANQKPDAHLLLTATATEHPQAAQHFLNHLQALHPVTPTDTPIHHPAVLAADLAPQHANTWAVVGYPGAGNVVLQNVLFKIDERQTQPKPSTAWQQAQRFAQHHAAVVRAAVDQLLQHAAQQTQRQLVDTVLAPGHLGQCSVRATLSQDTAFLLNHLPYAGFLNQPYGAHSRWNPEAAQFFPAFGYRRVYLAVRNPLAVLCSNAAKTVRPLEQALHDPDWFQPTAKQLALYHQHAQQQKHAFQPVRYEDLTQHPRDTIQKLGQDANLTLTDQQADHIWEQVGFKSLTPAGDEHLFNPTADKRPHFRPLHHTWIQNANLQPAFTDHGYPLPQPQDFPDQPLHTAQPNDQDIEKRPSALYGRIDPRTMHNLRDPQHQLWIRSNHEPLPQAFLDAFQKSHFQRITQTLDHRFGQLKLP